MKIIHMVLGKANPDRPNGVNQVVHNLAETAVKIGQEVEVWGITKNTFNDRDTTYKLRLFLRSRNRFSVDDELKEEINKEGNEVIFHLHGSLLPEFYAVAKYLGKLGKKWVVSPHGAYMPMNMRKNLLVKKLFYRMFDRKVLGGAIGVHVLNKHELNGIGVEASDYRAHIICNGFSVTELRSDFFGEEKNNQLIIGYIGRLVIETKGLDILIEGFSQYKKTGGNGVLWIVGGGEERSKLEEQVAQLNIKEHVLFYGAKYGEEKISILSAMDVFVHTSRWEGMPMAVLEAAGHAKPLILSEGTNLAAYVDRWEAGVALESNSPECFAKAAFDMQEALGTAAFNKMKHNARAMVERDFSWEGIVRSMTSTLYIV